MREHEEQQVELHRLDIGSIRMKSRNIEAAVIE